MSQVISASRLRELFHYDPETGAFTRRVTRCGRALAGATVGSRHHEGYVSVKIDGKFYGLHRLAWLYMTGEWPAAQVDHRNGERADNRWTNLRAATNAQNAQNRRHPRSDSSTGLVGVGSQFGKFQAAIKVDGRRRHLGTFTTREAAYAAYVATRNALFPDCAL